MRNMFAAKGKIKKGEGKARMEGQSEMLQVSLPLAVGTSSCAYV